MNKITIEIYEDKDCSYCNKENTRTYCIAFVKPDQHPLSMSVEIINLCEECFDDLIDKYDELKN